MNEIEQLLEIMRQLRDPEKGCPWDRVQTFETILPYTQEEVHELADAIRRNAMKDVCDELGDLLFHIVFYAQLADEKGYFEFRNVAAEVNKKLQRRHPHVFSGATFTSRDEQNKHWEKIKLKERQQNADAAADKQGLLDGIGSGLAEIARSLKMQRRAATVGFDWQNTTQVMEKIDEELKELQREIQAATDTTRITEEFGDLMFSCINLARHLKIDPELALRKTNNKFKRRFEYLEKRLKTDNRSLYETNLEEMESLWQESKRLD